MNKIRHDTTDGLFLRDSEMVRQFRATDWSGTPLGPLVAWPQSLRTAVGVCLNSRFPMFVWWGPQRINIYNDAYIPVLGKRHPTAFGRPAQQVWSEIWPDVGPQADAVMQRGEATWNERVPLLMERNGYSEETWFTWSYSPIPDEAGAIGGLFCACTEETGRVLADARVSKILTSITDGFFSLDRDWCYSYVNPECERILGREAADLIGQSLWEAYPGTVGSEFERAYRKAAAERVSVAFTSYYPDHDRWYEVRTFPTTDGLSIYFRDVTDQQRAGAKPKESEQRFRVIADTAPAMLWVTDEHGSCTYLSRGWYQFTGQQEGEGHGLGWTNAIHPEDKDAAGQAFMAASNAREDYAIDFRLRRVDGTYRWVIGAGHPFIDADGTFRGFVGSVFDIDDRKRATEQLAQSEERFRVAVSATSDILWTNSADGKMIGKQPSWAEFTGLSYDEYQGYGWASAVHPDDSKATISAWEEAVRERKTFVFEHRVRRKDGVYRVCSIRAVPVLDDAGEIREWVGVHTDVTDRHEALQQREQLLGAERAARMEAERVGRMKDEFLGTLSHELRTPLNAILGWVQLLGRERTDEDLNQGLDVIERNARIQAQLIEDLLDMSRIISGKIRLDVQRVELPDLIRAAIETVRPAAEAKRIRLMKVLDPLAGPVSGDPHRLQQVIWNLLSNAVKFTPAGGKVEVLLERVNSHLEISVSDTGKGIKPEFMPHVFERFQQADASTTRQHGGLGLGLAIVKQLVELHGGQVRVKSPGEGHGATFTVHLPLTIVKPSDPTEEARRHPHARSGADPWEAPKLTGVRVLVVDDEPDARELIRRLLCDYQADVTVACSAKEALSIFEEVKPHALVSDIGMPEMDGYDFIRRVRALGMRRGGHVPAVALTAFARAEDRTRALLAGYQAHVSKPVDANELVAMVASLAGRTGNKSEGDDDALVGSSD